MTNNRKKKKINWVNVIVFLVIYMFFVALGFILGMIYQQVLFTQEIGRVLSYTDLEINVNFNATEFTEGLNKSFQEFIPAWKEAFNKTVQEQFKK